MMLRAVGLLVVSVLFSVGSHAAWKVHTDVNPMTDKPFGVAVSHAVTPLYIPAGASDDLTATLSLNCYDNNPKFMLVMSDQVAWDIKEKPGGQQGAALLRWNDMVEVNTFTVSQQDERGIEFAIDNSLVQKLHGSERLAVDVPLGNNQSLIVAFDLEGSLAAFREVLVFCSS